MAWSYDDIGDLAGTTALVTGANSGVGFGTAQHLANHGAHVVLGCRSPQRAADAVAALQVAVPHGSFSVLQVDLADLASVRRAATELSEKHDKLDVMVNNAGIALAPEGRTADGFEAHLGANYLGHFALTAHLVPLVLAAPAGRVVHVASIQHLVGRIVLDDLDSERRRYRAWVAYGQSKLATLLFMSELDRRLRAAGANALSIGAHPGVAGTNVHEDYAIAQVRWLRPAVDWVVGSVLQTAEEGARSSLMAATAPGVAGGSYLGPRGVISGAPGPARMSRRAQDPAMARRLWAVAEERTGTQFPL